MDKLPKTQQQAAVATLAAVADAARALGLHLEILKAEAALGRRRADAWVQVTKGQTQAQYLAEVRLAIRRDNLGATLHQLKQLGPGTLLITDYAMPEVADELRMNQVEFIDAAGNAYMDQPTLYVWVAGRKPAVKPGKQTVGRAFRPNGLQVLFILLCDPALVNIPIRKLAEMAGVAHGTVGTVIQDLKAQGFVMQPKGRRGDRRLLERQRLLDQWTDAYVRQLRPRNLIGRYYLPTIDDWETWDVEANDVQWGGEPAAALLTQYLRPGELTIYADQLPGKLALAKRFAKDAEPGRTAVVEVRKRFWKIPTAPVLPGVVPPLLVYADLLATRDARCHETATMIRKDHVARFLDEA